MTITQAILEKVQNLTPQQQEEVLNFIESLNLLSQKQDIKQPHRRKWQEIKGKVPFPLVGEDAQIWVSRNRNQATEYRELNQRSIYED
jgi:hypothetical protein